jgi:osmotically inducible protein OsmC
MARVPPECGARVALFSGLFDGTGATMAVSRAHASWSGALGDGSGEVSAQSGAFTNLPLSWGARTQRGDHPTNTSPEELLAAAHAGCYAMAFSHTLDEAGHPPERLDVECAVHFTPEEGGGFRISRSELSVRGRVPGVTPERFDELAVEGDRGCPVSNLFRGDAEIVVEATLEAV